MSAGGTADIPDQTGHTVLITGVAVSLAARNEHTARLLWERTAELTGVTPDPA